MFSNELSPSSSGAVGSPSVSLLSLSSYEQRQYAELEDVSNFKSHLYGVSERLEEEEDSIGDGINRYYTNEGRRIHSSSTMMTDGGDLNGESFRSRQSTDRSSHEPTDEPSRRKNSCESTADVVRRLPTQLMIDLHGSRDHKQETPSWRRSGVRSGVRAPLGSESPYSPDGYDDIREIDSSSHRNILSSSRRGRKTIGTSSHRFLSPPSAALSEFSVEPPLDLSKYFLLVVISEEWK